LNDLHVRYLAQALRDQAKFPYEQAEATARALAASMTEAAPVTTQELDYRLKDLEQRLVIKLGGMMIVAVGIILAGLRYFSIH
jgi:hypothetical protein